ncbi:hypothetical protein WR25_22677 [Diploscapter pachys]|uniref:Doublecortin domain-containing protein n=1 Tax=Diploscapter pachys TaxID=2018661 RepID=A0A2A2L1B6_9BILA|nr:hypothetical protein WR25_22677 [Diploscapter pachys]
MSEGKRVALTRRQFKHWIKFLDHLTEVLHAHRAVRKLFTINGVEIQNFEDLDDSGEYVAVETLPFLSVNYGRTKHLQKFCPVVRQQEEQDNFLNSAETMDIYLKKEGFGSSTGLPYPLDAISNYSPNASAMHRSHFISHTHKVTDTGENVKESVETWKEETTEQLSKQPTSAVWTEELGREEQDKGRQEHKEHNRSRVEINVQGENELPFGEGSKAKGRQHREIPRLTGLNDGEEMEKTDRKTGGEKMVEEATQTEVAGILPIEGAIAVQNVQKQDEMLKEINGNSKTEGAVSCGNETIEEAIEQCLCEYHRRMQMQKDKEKGKQEKQGENRENENLNDITETRETEEIIEEGGDGVTVYKRTIVERSTIEERKLSGRISACPAEAVLAAGKVTGAKNLDVNPSANGGAGENQNGSGKSARSADHSPAAASRQIAATKQRSPNKFAHIQRQESDVYDPDFVDY